jgi:polyhydroxybutyrate depolymerase
VIESGGLARTYRVYRPAALDRSRPVPLVVMLHGGFGSGEQAEQAYGWDAKADSAGFVVAYPDGVARAWNAGTCCGLPQRTNIDDVGFLRQLIDRLASDENVDPDRVFATGISNGAMMAYRLACELPGRLAAIGPVAGTMTVPCDGATPTSVLHVHGLADQNVPYEGGVGTKGVSKDSRPSVPSVIARWRQVDGCGPSQVSLQGPVHMDTADGARGTTVTLITIDGAGHQWPGSQQPNPVAKRVLQLDDPSTAIDATSVLWSFFSAHTRPA